MSHIPHQASKYAELRICTFIGERLHPYGVLPQSRVLPAGRRPYGPEAGPGFFTVVYPLLLLFWSLFSAEYQWQLYTIG
jgi:hypothetical protein